MTTIKLSPSAARQVVAAGTPARSASIQHVSRPSVDMNESVRLRPCRLRSYWSQDSDGAWTAKAVFIDDESGSATEQFDVYARTGGSPPAGAPFSWTFYAFSEGGKWYSVQQPQPDIEYIGGNYISIDLDRTINNAGVWSVKIPGEIYEDTHTLYLDKNIFTWIPSSLDIVGKREVSLKTERVTFISGITVGQNSITFTTTTRSML